MKFLKAMVWILIALLLVFGAIKLIKRKKAQEAKMEAKKEYKIVVDTLKLKTSDITLTLPYLSTVMSDESANISTKVAGRILQIPKSGDRVKKGEVIVKIDDNELRDKLNALKLSKESIKININAKKILLKNAILTHKRTKKLLDVQGASIEQYQNEEDKIELLKAGISSLKSSLKVTDAKIKELENLITYTTIKAPFDGVVSQVYATIGDMAMPGKPIIKLQGKSRYLLVALPSNIKTKTILYKGKRYALKPLDKTINSLPAYRVDANIKAKVGQRVEIRVVAFEGKGVLIPQTALLQNGDKDYIFVVNEDKAIQKEVKVLGSGEEGVAIDAKYDGLNVVVAKPDIFLKLVSGVKIKIGR